MNRENESAGPGESEKVGQHHVLPVLENSGIVVRVA